MSYPNSPVPAGMRMQPAHAAHMRSVVVGVIGFLTLVDLFAAQAILPSLLTRYQVSRAAIGFAVNASTIGMAVSCLAVALVSRHINRRTGIWVSLALLAVPTSLLAVAPDLASFTALRLTQGVFMAAAFTLTMAYLAEHCSAEDTARALAAYITGVVASNLVGRFVAAAVADMYGLSASFYLFAMLNLSGAALVLVSLDRMAVMASPGAPRSPLAAWGQHLGSPALRAAFGIGFLILFAFIGIFTYVNFELSGPRLGVGQMMLGVVYLVFLPSMLTTPLAGRTAVRVGTRRAVWAGLAVAAAGLPLIVSASLWAVLGGMVLVGVGTFFAQAVATGFVGRAASSDRAAASGLYLASYYLGGIAGAAVLGQVYDRLGWTACVAAVGVSLLAAALLAVRMQLTEAAQPG
ncbi:MFS transporter [Rhodobacteraceae bacterium 2CG4]|uniref:MFS transporter n=1 Tax=Halovulum marinum TaxID=2662447 RepID=A0A6L5YWU7_9RHOB|nr:MFS transporter [Halovulum marinum]MSU88450.1 MFS transporter [Halovulum marinum]